MWFKSFAENDFINAQYTSQYPSAAIEAVQTAIVRAVMLLGDSELSLTEDEAADSERVLLALLHDIRSARFIPVGFPDKLVNLINDELKVKEGKIEQ